MIWGAVQREGPVLGEHLEEQLGEKNMKGETAKKGILDQGQGL